MDPNEIITRVDSAKRIIIMILFSVVTLSQNNNLMLPKQKIPFNRKKYRINILNHVSQRR